MLCRYVNKGAFAIKSTNWGRHLVQVITSKKCYQIQKINKYFFDLVKIILNIKILKKITILES